MIQGQCLQSSVASMEKTTGNPIKVIWRRWVLQTITQAKVIWSDDGLTLTPTKIKINKKDPRSATRETPRHFPESKHSKMHLIIRTQRHSDYSSQNDKGSSFCNYGSLHRLGAAVSYDVWNGIFCLGSLIWQIIFEEKSLKRHLHHYPINSEFNDHNCFDPPGR